MKKLFMMAALIVGTMPIAAQETYENVKIAQEDLNGRLAMWVWVVLWRP